MEIPYTKCESGRGFVFRPLLSISFTNKGKKFPIGHALVDTGSDITILPLEVAHALEVELDDAEAITIDAAGGGRFRALPSRRKIGYEIQHKGFRPIRWEGVVYFAENEPVVLLGHYQCLELFDLTFQGSQKKLSILPNFPSRK